MNLSSIPIQSHSVPVHGVVPETGDLRYVERGVETKNLECVKDHDLRGYDCRRCDYAGAARWENRALAEGENGYL